MNPEEELVAVVIDDDLTTATPHGRTMNRILAGLSGFGIQVSTIGSIEGARSAYANLPEADCILINWDIGNDPTHVDGRQLIREIRERNDDIPIFLMAEPARESFGSIGVETLKEIDEFVYIMDDTPEFIAGRITAAANRYKDRLLPPFFGELVRFSRDYEYSWHTPGHAGGTAFRKSPAGRLFFKFFGEQLFRSDLSISVGELGSLLDHSGPLGEAERYAARVFGADLTYFVTNGTSTANKIVFFGRVTTDDIVLVDRNCHKSAEHALTMTHSRAVFMNPTRNRYGIIGPIPPGEMTPDAVREKIGGCPLTRDLPEKRAVHAIITNSTYDGLCYDATRVEETLGKSVDSIHFDEAWYGYARFNPLYTGRFAMRDGARDPSGPTVFATQSTHKLLAGLSQASQILVQDSETRKLDFHRFNEAYLMHTSTSPQYAIIASCDVAAAMMEPPGGPALVEESIREALDFRRAMRKVDEEFGDSWWFKVWGPQKLAEEDVGDREDWMLEAGARWHEFGNIAPGFNMLDPIKATVITPGLDMDGAFADWGIPAAIVTKYLAEHGVIVEKTGLYSFFIMFTIGITKGRWNTLVTALQQFKADYDENQPLWRVLPEFIEKHPRYEKTGLKDLCDQIHTIYKANDVARLTTEMYLSEMAPAMKPADAFAKMAHREIERVDIDHLEGRITAMLVTPYPPGIPLLIPGERFNATIVRYLQFTRDFNEKFPGFETDVHGLVEDMADGKARYYVDCVM